MEDEAAKLTVHADDISQLSWALIVWLAWISDDSRSYESLTTRLFQ